MGDRKFDRKKRNSGKRHRNSIMLITGEGKNQTEKLYFNSFNEYHGKYVIRFVNTGLDTDPARMLRSMTKAWKRNNLSRRDGDKAYIVLDMDCNPQKVQQIKELQKTTDDIQFIMSNPCIEIWFILHFSYTTHQFKDSKEPKRELTRYIPEYTESRDISNELRNHLEEASENVLKLKRHFESINITWGNADCNPMTDVPEILRELGALDKEK